MSRPAEQLQRFEITGPGERLDHALARLCGVSHGEARRLLDAGMVQLNGRAVKLSDKGRRLAAGDAVGVMRDADGIRPEESASVRVLTEGDGWVAVNKPAGVPVHPLRPGETGTVLNAVAARYPQVQGVGEGGLRSGVVHRLDVDTSGVLVVATGDASWRQWREAFTQRRVDKRYLAIAAGRLEGESDLSLPLAVTRHRPAKVRVVEPSHPGARRCDLRWRSIASSGAASLLEVTLGTGFLHQIRAMLAHLGHPLVGDARYGAPMGVAGAGRPMLHAARLRWGDIDARCDPPEDFMAALAALGLPPPTATA